MTTTSTNTTQALAATPPKVFHNTRCTRHHKAHHSHSHNSLSNDGSSNDFSHLNDAGGGHRGHHIHHIPNGHGHRKKTESVLSTDSDIRFTRRKLGDSQKCGCAVIAGFLVALLVAGAFVYVGCR